MHGEGSMNHSSEMTYTGLWSNGEPVDAPSVLVVVNEVVTLEHSEMAFTLDIECRTSEGDFACFPDVHLYLGGKTDL